MTSQLWIALVALCVTVICSVIAVVKYLVESIVVGKGVLEAVQDLTAELKETNKNAVDTRLEVARLDERVKNLESQNAA